MSSVCSTPCPFSLCLGVKVYSHVTPEPVSRISFRQSGQQLAVTEDKLGHVCCAMFIKLISSCLNSYHAHCIVQLDDLHVLVNFQRMKLGAVKNLGRAGGFLRQVELFKYFHGTLCKCSNIQSCLTYLFSMPGLCLEFPSRSSSQSRSTQGYSSTTSLSSPSLGRLLRHSTQLLER